MRRNRKALAFLAILLFIGGLSPCRAQETANRSGKLFLWKISSPTATVYLLGSVHLAPERIYPLPEEIEKAFLESEAAVFEVNVTANPAQSYMLMETHGIYPPQDSLKNHVSADTYKMLFDTLERLKITLPQAERMRPWYLGANLPALMLVKSGYQAAAGIDMHFLTRCPRMGKPVEELETAEFQVRALSSFADDVQETMLRLTLQDLDKTSTEVDGMFTAWEAGDAEAMGKIVDRMQNQDPTLRVVWDKILTERNHGMMNKIGGFLKETKTRFVVVGSAHVIGAEGIVELARKAGYTVEQLSRKDQGK